MHPASCSGGATTFVPFCSPFAACAEPAAALSCTPGSRKSSSMASAAAEEVRRTVPGRCTNQLAGSPGRPHMHVGGGTIGGGGGTPWRLPPTTPAGTTCTCSSRMDRVGVSLHSGTCCRCGSRSHPPAPTCHPLPQVPVPPQYKHQPLYDFRHFPSETRGYKVGAGTCWDRRSGWLVTLLQRLARSLLAAHTEERESHLHLATPALPACLASAAASAAPLLLPPPTGGGDQVRQGGHQAQAGGVCGAGA